MKTSFLAPSLFALLLTVTAAACDAQPTVSHGSFFCSDPVDIQMVKCETRSSATVVAPEGFALPAKVQAMDGNNCLAVDGTCSLDSQVFFQGERDEDGQGLNFGVFVPRSQGPGRYSLASGTEDGPGTFYGRLYRTNPATDFSDYYSSDLLVRSGTLTVLRNDTQGLRATFDAEVETADGLHHLSLRGGNIEVSDCAVRTVAYCEGH
jgi:hypothetical protein